jgi:hypothetical protein
VVACFSYKIVQGNGVLLITLIMLWLLCSQYRNRVKSNSSSSYASLVHVSFASPTAVARLRSLSHSVSEIIGEC